MHIHCPISAQIRLVITNHTPEFWYVVLINRWWCEENCTSKLPLEFYFYFKKNIVFNEVYLLCSLTVDRLVLTMEREVLANLHWCITHQGNFIHHDKHYIKFVMGISLSINPLHPKIGMHILHTVFCSTPKVLTKRICLSVLRIFSWWSFPLFSWPYCVMQGLYCWEKLYVSHSWGLKVHWTLNREGSGMKVDG